MKNDWIKWAEGLADQLEAVLSNDPDMPTSQDTDQTASDFLDSFREWQRERLSG